MPASGPIASSIAIRISLPSTMPATRKIPKNSNEFCAQGEVSLPSICGDSSAMIQSAIGIAIR